MAGDITRFLFRFRSDIQRMTAEADAKKRGLSLNAWLQSAVDFTLSDNAGRNSAGEASRPERAKDTPHNSDVVTGSNPVPGTSINLKEQLRASIAQIMESSSVAPIEVPPNEKEYCSYTEYDGESGETMACGLHHHSTKVKHGAWRKL